MHSTDSGFVEDKEIPENFKDDWYSQKNKRNHIVSNVYANQDFMGLAPVGKNGVSDINTYSKVNWGRVPIVRFAQLGTGLLDFAKLRKHF